MLFMMISFFSPIVLYQPVTSDVQQWVCQMAIRGDLDNKANAQCLFIQLKNWLLMPLRELCEMQAA
jgi:hypothetical protein